MGKASRQRRERMEQVQKAREIEGLVKRARFYDRLLQDVIIDEDSELLPSSVPILADNVMSYIRSHKPTGELSDILPPIPPPLSNFLSSAHQQTKNSGFIALYMKMMTQNSLIRDKLRFDGVIA